MLLLISQITPRGTADVYFLPDSEHKEIIVIAIVFPTFCLKCPVTLFSCVYLIYSTRGGSTPTYIVDMIGPLSKQGLR